MTQNPQTKKPASSQAASQGMKMAAGAANKMSQSAYSAAEQTRKSAQNVVNISGGAVRDILASGSGEMQKAQEKAFEMSREGVENFARSADMATKLMTEVVSICRENIDACIESCNTAANMCKDMSAEIVESCNRSFSDCVDLSKEAFSCRTVNDIVELQNKAFRQIIDACFSETNKLCNMAFQCCTEALEPINERVTEASERLCKTLAA